MPGITLAAVREYAFHSLQFPEIRGRLREQPDGSFSMEDDDGTPSLVFTAEDVENLKDPMSGYSLREVMRSE